MTTKFVSPPNRQFFISQVWEIVRQVPAGKVTTYGQIASMIPTPEGKTARDFDAFGARWVGGAMAACPPDVPWQRVINSQGKISLRDGAAQQRALLEAEGVQFDDRGRVDLAIFGWQGPPEAWCKAHGVLQPPSLGKPTQLTMKF